MLQKAMAPEFLDGSFFAHLIDTGALGGPSWALCSACELSAEANVDAIVARVEGAPTGRLLPMTSVIGADAQWVARAGQGFALAVLVFEIKLLDVEDAATSLKKRQKPGPAAKKDDRKARRPGKPGAGQRKKRQVR